MSSSLRSLVAVTLSVAALPALAAVFDEDAVPGTSPQEQYQMVRERDAKLLGAHARNVRGVVANPTGEPSAMGLDARVMPNNANPGASPTEVIARRPSPANLGVASAQYASVVNADATGEPGAMGLDARVMPNNANPGASPTEAIARQLAPADHAVSAAPGALPVRAVSQICSCVTPVKG